MMFSVNPPKGVKKNMTHVTCTKCNHFGLILFDWDYRNNCSVLKCVRCKERFEMFVKKYKL